MRSRITVAGAMAALAILTAPEIGAAQAGSADLARPMDVCFRFTFGAWSPPLDWRAAGHRAPRDSSRTARAGSGRGSAAEVSVRGDSALLLLPSWWPAGVLVELPTRSPAFGDTLTGRATAFVADGSARPPVSAVRAWRVACGGSPSSP